jgi:hypothetical protein
MNFAHCLSTEDLKAGLKEAEEKLDNCLSIIVGRCTVTTSAPKLYKHVVV